MLNGQGNEEEVEKKRHRSPSYPTVGLQEAVERVRNLYTKDGKAGAPPALAAVHIGFGKAHGQAYSVLSALKKFGLVSEANGRLVPTQRALEILNLPESDPRRAKALQEAIVEPAIYRELIEQHRETGWPAQDVLASELITYRNFNPNAAEGFVRDLMASLEFAGLSGSSALGLEAGDQMEMDDSAQVRLEGNTQKHPPSSKTTGLATGSFLQTTPKVVKEIFNQRVSPDCTVQVSFDGPVTQKAIDKLIAYLELAKDNYPSNGGQ